MTCFVSSEQSWMNAVSLKIVEVTGVEQKLGSDSTVPHRGSRQPQIFIRDNYVSIVVGSKICCGSSSINNHDGEKDLWKVVILVTVGALAPMGRRSCYECGYSLNPKAPNRL